MKKDLFKSIIKKTVLIILIVLTIIQLTILVGWIIKPWIKTELLDNLIQTETWFLRFTTTITPTLFMVGIYTWLVKPLTKIFRKKPKFFQKMVEKIKKFETLDLPVKKSTVIIFFAVCLGLVLTLYPYNPTINPEVKPIGVDAKRYIDFLHKLIIQPSISQAINQAFTTVDHGQRPLHLLILYFIALFTEANILDLVKFQLPFLILFTLFTVYFFTFEGLKNRFYASTITLFTASSYLVTVGVFAAFYSNLFALSFCYLFLTFLLKYSVKPLKKFFWLMLGTSIPIIFIHPWTWSMLMGITFIYPLLKFSRKNFSEKFKKEIFPVALILAINVFTDLAIKSLIFQTLTGGAIAYTTVTSNIEFANLKNFPSNLFMTIRIFSGGIYSNFLILFLSTLGIFSVGLHKDNFHQLLLAWILITSLIFPISNIVLQSRLIFNLPLQIFTVEGLFLLGALAQSGKNSKIRLEVKLLFLLLITASFSYAFRCVLNTVISQL